MKISVVGAVRGRVHGFIEGVDSLIKQAEDISQVEFIFRFDKDDENTIEKVREYYSETEINLKILVGKRHGYLFMNKYWDECVNESDGEYILTWTDDMTMHHENSKGWDTEIRKFKHNFFILDFPDAVRYPKWPTGVVFPRKLFEILGNRLCPNLILDRWFVEILKINDIWVRFNKRVRHNQAFSGGAPRDATFDEGRLKWNNSPRGGFEGWEDFDRNDFDIILNYIKENPNSIEVQTDKTYYGTEPGGKGERFWTP